MFPRLSSLPGPITLLLALVAWTAWFFVFERAFLPEAGRTLFDTRALVWSNDDKVVEAHFFEDRTPAHMLHGLFNGAPPDPRLGEHYNLLPRLMLRAMTRLLPTIPAYNLLLLLSALANCLAAALLAHAMAQDRWAAFWAGTIYGSAPFLLRVMAFCSLDFAMAFWLPLFLWALLAVARRPSPSRMAGAAVLLLALGASNFYALLAAVPPCLPCCWPPAPPPHAGVAPPACWPWPPWAGCCSGPCCG